jgi:hypothetical protein
VGEDIPQGREIEDLVAEYFPRDTVQVLEDLRVAQQQDTPLRVDEANVLLGALEARFPSN